MFASLTLLHGLGNWLLADRRQGCDCEGNGVAGDHRAAVADNHIVVPGVARGDDRDVVGRARRPGMFTVL